MTDDGGIWSALAFVGGQNNKANAAAEEAAKKAESEKRRYQKRILNLQKEVEDVNEEATNTRRLLWVAQDKLKESEDQIRKLENHLNEVLELREKDLQNIKSLRVANSDCVENESRAREAMEVFKKCYKRAQVKIKEHEEEILALREHRASVHRGPPEEYETTNGMVNESALEYIQSVSNEKEKRLKKMLSETEVEVDLWKSKYKVANKRCMNWQEQILAMEHPTEGAAHIKRQRIQIENLEAQIKAIQQKEAEQQAQKDCRNPFECEGVAATPCHDDARDGLTTGFLENFQSLNCSQ